MKKIVCALAAFSALAVALPAAAQPYGGPGRGHGYGDMGLFREIEQLDNRVDRACARRTISRSECSRLNGQVGYLKTQLRGYMRGGLTRWERQTVQNGIYRVQANLRHERRDDDYGRGRGRH